MSDSTDNSPAQPGDTIRKGDLQDTADGLMAMAKLLLPDIENATSATQLAQVMKAHGDLLAQARKLVENDIALIVGEAKVSADQIRAAITESQKVIEKIQQVKSKLEKVGAVLDFVAAVATGSGSAIFAAANKLHGELKA